MKNSKKFMAYLLTLMLVMSTVMLNGTLALANDNITVMIDGQRVNFTDQQPIIVDNRTLVPVRGVFEQLGFTVEWSETSQTATLRDGKFIVMITIGREHFTVTDETQQDILSFDVPAQIINNRTMIPFRAVLESVGCAVNWDNATRTINIATNNTTSIPSGSNWETRYGADGEIFEGIFDNITGNLIEGKATYPGGEILEGKFDSITGRIIEGKGTLPHGDGDKLNWDFLRTYVFPESD